MGSALITQGHWATESADTLDRPQGTHTGTYGVCVCPVTALSHSAGRLNGAGGDWSHTITCSLPVSQVSLLEYSQLSAQLTQLKRVTG